MENYRNLTRISGAHEVTSILGNSPLTLQRRKKKLQEVMKFEYMSHEESTFEDESDEESRNQRLEKLVIRKFEWRREELEPEFRGLDRKANRARSERGRRMMVAREMGSFLLGSLHSFPKDAPSWALVEAVRQ